MGYADLILISKLEAFDPIMEKIKAEAFNCKSKVDFSSAVGIRIDVRGHLHIWNSHKYAKKQIVVNKFPQK